MLSLRQVHAQSDEAQHTRAARVFKTTLEACSFLHSVYKTKRKMASRYLTSRLSHVNMRRGFYVTIHLSFFF